jgi:hypothetical protein
MDGKRLTNFDLRRTKSDKRETVDAKRKPAKL